MSMEPLHLTLSDFEGIPLLKSLKVPKYVTSLSQIDLFSFRMGLLNYRSLVFEYFFVVCFKDGVS